MNISQSTYQTKVCKINSRIQNIKGSITMKKIIVSLISGTLIGCASVPSQPDCRDDGDEYQWYPNPIQMPTTLYSWEVDTTTNAKHRCNVEDSPNISCLMGRIRETKTAHIVSSVSREDAAILKTGNLSLLDHELKHARGCLHLPAGEIERLKARS